MNLLVRTPSQFDGESPCGFVLRVSELNGYTTPRSVFQMAICERSEIFSISMDMSKIARILGRNPNELTGYRDTEEKDFFRLNILGHHLTAKDLNLAKPKVCPQCVTSLGYIPVWTEFLMIDACPWHGRRLLTHCTICKQPLSWLRPGLLVCRCNADLSCMRGSPLTSVHCEFLRQLVAKILGSESANRFAMPVEKFKDMSLSSVLGFSKAMSRMDKAANKEPRSVAEGAARMLLDWPNSLHLSIRKMIPPDAATKGYVDMRKHMEGVYLSVLRDVTDASDVAFLRNVINQFTQSFIDQVPCSVNLSSEEIEALEPVSDLNSIDPLLLATLERAPQIKRKRQPRNSSGKRSRLSPGPGSRNFEIRQAAKYIGLPTAVLAMLRRTGRFEVRHRTAAVGKFHEGDLDTFINKMMALVQITPSLPVETETVSLASLMRLKFNFTQGKSDLVTAILDGDIPVLAQSGPSVRDLLVSQSRIDEFIETSRSKAYGDTWSEFKVSEVLHCDPSVVEGLVREKFLTGARYASGARVDIDSVQHFQLKYRSLASLAKEHRTTAATLVRLLKDVGFEMLKLKRGGNDFLQSFIQLSDIPRFEELVIPSLFERRHKPPKSVTALDRLEAYLSALRHAGQGLPRVGQKPNLIKIAEACEFERNVFYRDEGIKKAIKAFDVEDRLHNNVLSPKDVLNKYLSNLKTTGDEVPYWGSGPNLRLIAVQCGFSRNVFYNHPELLKMVGKRSHSSA